MGTFTLTPGVDNFSGDAAGNNFFFFTPATLQATDTITGGSSGPTFSDRLVLTAAGTVTASQFAGVTNMEILSLSSAGNNVTLTNGLVAGTSTGQFVVFGSGNNDGVDASGITNGTRILFLDNGGGADSVIGGNGNDYFQFGFAQLTSADTVTGGSGFDVLALGGGPGTVAASAFTNVTGIEELLLSSGVNVTLTNGLVGTSGPFVVYDGSGNEIIDASGISNGTRVVFFASTGNDTLTGGNGSDYFQFNAADLTAADTVNGGAGFDILAIGNGGTVAASAFTNVTGIEELLLSNAANNVSLTNSLVGVNPFVVYDGTGADTIDASGVTNGNRVVFFAGVGNDTLLGGNGSDVFAINAADLTSGDTITGGGGLDILLLNTGGTVAASALANVTGLEELVLSNAGNNVSLTNGVVGTPGPFVVYDGTGNDVVDASLVTNGTRVVFNIGSGTDSMTGGNGSDFFAISTADLTAADTIHGGAGSDFLQFTTTGVVTAANLAGVSGIESVGLLAGNAITLANTLTSAGSLDVFGTSGAETVDGSLVSGYDIVFHSSGGADVLKGGSGNDAFLIQDSAFTQINGGSGVNDRIVLSGVGQTLNVSANAAKISNIDVLWLDLSPSNNETVTLAAADITAISGASNTLYVVGSSDDQVSAGAGWTLMNTGVTNATLAPGYTFNEYLNSNGATLFIADQIAASITTSSNNPPDIELGGFPPDGINPPDGPDWAASYTTGDTNGVAIADVDARYMDADPVGVNSRPDHLTVTLTNPHSNDATTREYFFVTAAGHTLAAANGITITGENTTTLTLTAPHNNSAHPNAADFQDLLRDIRYVDTDVRPGQDYSDRIIHVDAQDQGNGSNTAAQRTTTIDLTKGNIPPDAPTDNDGAANSVLENAPAGSTVGVTAHATDPDGDPVTYSLTDNAGGRFAIGSGTGIVTLTGPLDFETDPHSYSITVQAADNHGGTSSASFSIALADANDNAPVFTSSATPSVAENTTTVVALTTTDADTVGTNPPTFTVTGGADQGLFTITGGNQLAFIAARDFETQAHSYAVQVTANDGTNNTVQNLTVTLTDTNDTAPVFTSSATPSVAENTTAVVDLTTTDADTVGTNPPTFTVTGGADSGLFTITGGNHLAFIAGRDFETQAHSYAVQVTANDGVNNTPQNITVTLTDTNDNAPVFTSSATPSVAENTTAVVALTTTDADTVGTNPPTFSITGGADSTLFTITGGNQLAFIAPHDFETEPHSYAVQVTANDGTNNTVQNLTVTLTDTNDNAPVFTSSATPSVAENTTAVVALTTTDADTVGTNPPTFSITGGGDSALFTITGGNQLAFIAPHDFETEPHSYAVQVTANDGANNTPQNITVTLTDTNDNTPTFTSSASPTVFENNTAVVDLTTTDPDTVGANPPTFTITGGADQAKFTITGGNHLAFISAPDFENPTDSGPDNVYDVQVTANDGTNNTVQNIAVTVADINDAPTLSATPTNPLYTPGVDLFNAVTASTIETGQFIDQLVFTVSNVNDTDETMSIDGTSVALTDGNLVTPTAGNGMDVTVAVVGTTATVTISKSGGVDASTIASIVDGMTYTDAAPPTGSRAITITSLHDTGGTLNGGVDTSNPGVTSTILFNQPPVIDQPANADTFATSIAENTTAVTTVHANDPDNSPVTPVTYSIVNAFEDGALFQIGSTSGVLSFISAPNFENPQDTATDGSNTYIVKVQASDGASTDTQTITVTVNDVNEAPTANPDTASVTEAGGVANGTAGVNITSGFNVITGAGTGSVADTDPDAGQTLTVVGAAAGTQAGPLSGNVNTALSTANNYGTFTIQPGGDYTYTVNQANATVQGLRTFNDTLTDTFSYTIQDDGAGNLKSTTTVTVTIHGQNDNPVANADSVTVAEKGGVNNATGGTDITGFTFNAITGAGTGNFADTDVDAGETLKVIGVLDGNHLADPNSVTGNIGAGVSDNNNYGTLTFQNTGGGQGDGSYNFVVNQANTNFLLATEHLDLVYTYKIQDLAGATSVALLNVRINGADDLAQATADTGSMTEDASATIFPVESNDVTDPDHDALNTISLGSVTVSSAAAGTSFVNSDATVTLANSSTAVQVALGAAFQQLHAGETATITVPYTLTGSPGQTSTVNLVVTVSGANDVPLAQDDTGSMTEDQSGQAFPVLPNDTQDPDHGAPNTVTPGAVANLVAPLGENIDVSDITIGVNGSKQITVTLGADFQHMKQGETTTFDVPYTLQGDQAGDTANATLHVTVNGANDAPTAQNFTFNGANSATANTSLVLDDGVGAAAPDPAGPQKTITGSLLTGATDVDGPQPLAVVAQNNAVTAGGHGHVTVSTTGEFSYLPNAGFIGSDTFNYTVTDGNTPTAGTDTKTVTINVIAPKVWYVDATNGSDATGDGTSDNPFQTLASLNGAGGAGDVDAAGDTIFLYNGTYTTASGFQLEDNETLISQSQGLVVPDGGGGGGTVTLVTASGANATVAGGIILASGNTINGIDATTSSSSQTGLKDNGGTVGTLTVSNSTVSGSGQAINITHGGALNVTLGTVSSSGGTDGIALGGALTGSFTGTAGTLSGHSGSEVNISGGASTISYGGTIGDGTGNSASITGLTGGSVALSGNINDGADGGGGIGISGNANATITFSGATKTLNTVTGDAVSIAGSTGTTNVNFTGGGLDIDTTNGSGFIAAGGAVSVTGSGNSITTTGTGAIVNMSGVALGASGVTFGSLQSTGASVNQTAILLNDVDGNTFTSGGVSIAGVTGAGNDGIRISGGSSSTFNFNGTTTVNNTADDGIALSGANGAVTFNSVALNGMTGDGIDISGNTNSVTVSGGTIGNTNDPAGMGVNVNTSGTGDVSVAASITKASAGNVVNVSGHTGGTVAFSGAISGTGAVADGVNLSSNTGATINFSGGMTLTTGASTAFNATGGGTVNVTNGANNHITTTSGTAVNITDTIGGSGVTFHDVSSNGASSGIILNNTGAGSFTVTGDGGAANNHSGGQIVSSTGSGVSLTTTGPVSLNYLDITNSGADGINASGVNGFTNTRSIISDNGGGAADEGMQLTNISGTVSIDHTNITNAPHNGIFLHNTNTNLTSFSYTNGTITDTVAQALGNDGILIETSGTTVLGSGTISGSTFSNIRATGVQTSAEDSSRIGFASGGLIGGTSGTGDDAANSLTVQNNTFSNNNIGVDFETSQIANQVFQLLTNTITGDHSHGINVSSTAGADTGPTSHYVVGKIDGNTVGTQGTLDSGSAIGNGLRVAAQGNATHWFLTVNNNTFHEVANQDVMSFIGQNGAGTTGTETMNFKITNNTITAATGTTQFGGTVQGGLGIFVLADEAAPVKTVITGNNVSTTNPAGEFDVYLAERTGPPAGSTLSVEGTGTVSSFIIANNTLHDANKFFDEEGNATLAAPGSGTFPLLAVAGGVAALSPTSGEMNLTQAELDGAVASGLAHWAAAGASAEQIAALQAMTFSVADLPSGMLGQEGAGHIDISSNAAGFGWFVDPTPQDNAEFPYAVNASGTDLLTDSSSDAAGHMDLLTAVMHEMGHVLGLDDVSGAGSAGDLMLLDLLAGERRLPDAGDVVHAAESGLSAAAQAPSGTAVLAGGAGDDNVGTGNGGNALLGAAGADTFVISQLPSAAPAHIADYSALQGDIIDVSAIVTLPPVMRGQAAPTDADMVRIGEDASGAFATLEVNSAGHWTAVAQLDGVHAGDAVNVALDASHTPHQLHAAWLA